MFQCDPATAVFCELPELHKQLTWLYAIGIDDSHRLIGFSLCRKWEGLDWIAVKLSHGRIMHQATTFPAAVTPSGTAVSLISVQTDVAAAMEWLKDRSGALVGDGESVRPWWRALPETPEAAAELLNTIAGPEVLIPRRDPVAAR